MFFFVNFHRSRERRRNPSRSPVARRNKSPTPPPKRRERSPQIVMTPEERDARTIFVMQVNKVISSGLSPVEDGGGAQWAD